MKDNKNTEEETKVQEESKMEDNVQHEEIVEESVENSVEETQELEPVTLSGEEYAELKKKTESVDEANDKYVRMYAEFENAKKLWEKQKQDCLKFGAFNILKDFASILDDIEAATSTLDIKKHKEYAEGLNMVYSKIKDVLENQGLKEIEAQGKAFDPHFHEALMFEENNELDEHTVVGIIQKGYMYEDKVLRPVRVKVSKKPVIVEKED